MSADNPLADAWLKLERAKLHRETLQADIREAGQGEPYRIPLRQELEKETGILRIRVARLTSRPEKWGVMLGDALHNYRSALDYGWWQLARRHLGREPTEDEAKQIQFPIIRDGGTWDERNHIRWVGRHAARFVGALQPNPRRDAPDTFHPLAVLRRFSNTDKHRNLHPTVHMLHELKITASVAPGVSPDELPSEIPSGYMHKITRPPQPGDEVFTVPANSPLRHPKVTLDAHQTGFVAIEGQWDVLALLESIESWTHGTLEGFHGLLNDLRITALGVAQRPITPTQTATPTPHSDTPPSGPTPP